MSKTKFKLIRDVEYRYLPPTEFRVEDSEKGKRLVGYVARFNKLSEDLGGFKEKIAPGTFRESIKNDDIRALMNHDANYVLGRTSNGTLRLEENSRGLKMEVDMPDTTYANDLLVSIERGDITGQSFGFQTLEDSWEVKTKDGEEENIRTLEKVMLIDTGPVVFPAYPQTDVAVRSMEAWKTERDNEVENQEEETTNPPEPTLDGEQENESTPKQRVSILKKKLELKSREFDLN